MNETECHVRQRQAAKASVFCREPRHEFTSSCFYKWRCEKKNALSSFAALQIEQRLQLPQCEGCLVVKALQSKLLFDCVAKT